MNTSYVIYVHSWSHVVVIKITVAGKLGDFCKSQRSVYKIIALYDVYDAGLRDVLILYFFQFVMQN